MSVDTLLADAAPGVAGSGTAAEPTTALVLPRVNLLPQEITEARRFRRAQAGMAAVLAAAVGVVLLLTLSASHAAARAAAARDAAQQQQSRAQAQVASLGWVQPLAGQAATAESTLATARSGEMRFSALLHTVSVALPPRVFLTDLTLGETGGSSPTTGGPSSSTAAGVGSASFQGYGMTHDDVAALLDTLARQKVFGSVYLSTATEAVVGKTPVVKFSVTATVAPGALARGAGR